MLSHRGVGVGRPTGFDCEVCPLDGDLTVQDIPDTRYPQGGEFDMTTILIMKGA